MGINNHCAGGYLEMVLLLLVSTLECHHSNIRDVAPFTGEEFSLQIVSRYGRETSGS